MTGPFITTLTRDYALTGDLSDSLVDINDIAMALARLNRFTGHTLLSWSVAQHSLLVLRLCEDCAAKRRLTGESTEHMPPHLARALLLHDAHEAYCGDVASPIKAALGDAWAAFETDHADHVRDALGIKAAMKHYAGAVRAWDLEALRVERARLLGAQRGRKPWPVIDGNGRVWTEPDMGALELMRDIQDQTHTRKSATDAFLDAYQRTTLAALRAAAEGAKQ